MRQIIFIILLTTIGQCYAGTLDMDTIDNWQIYNGTELVLAGHDSPPGTVFQGTIQRADLKDLAIQYNHDVVGELEIRLMSLLKFWMTRGTFC